ncbi:MAG: SpoIID/LytB domain-containing protein [Coriobacteriia bacterium]|nr:SpoIID/LytB domain-containing protein [Coriobacteriia bacterium]
MQRLLAGITVLALSLSMIPAGAQAAVPTFTLNGSGYGHGLGMSQYGAIGMGREGKSLSAIINQYYTGVAISKFSSSPSVKVNVGGASSSSRPSWMLTTASPKLSSLTIDGASKPRDFYTFTASGGVIFMQTGANLANAPKVSLKKSSITVAPVGNSGTALGSITVANASGPFSRTYTRYRGHMVLTASGSSIKLINVASMQEYLFGVVPRELGAMFNPAPATSQAQALCARSYAYAKAKAGSTLACSTADQVYGGQAYCSGYTNFNNDAWSSLEESHSNSAVTATNNQYVTYKGAVATTFFSSDNSDATANSEDVWSATVPYLRSKADPYSKKANPSHYWTVKMTGAQMASTLSSRGVRVPSGAYVTGVALTKATGGWNKVATFTFSNGTKTSVSNADNVRTKLGLKSANFTLTGGASPAPTPAPVVPAAPVGPDPGPKPATAPGGGWAAYEETSSFVARTGAWSKATNSASSGGAVYLSTAKGASISFRFKGDGIEWVGIRAATYGSATVTLDGVSQGSVNLRTAPTRYQQALFRKTGLDPNKTHLIQITVTSSAPAIVCLDRFMVHGTGSAPDFSANGWNAYEENNAVFTYAGAWGTGNTTAAYGGVVRLTSAAGASVSTRFTGTAIEVEGIRAATYGKLQIYIDDVSCGIIDCTATSSSYRQALFYKGGLKSGVVHKLTIVSRTTGSKLICLDRLMVYGNAIK